MIDLRNQSLPCAITVDGKDFLVKTDFREWLKFEKMIKEERPFADYLFLFDCEIDGAVDKIFNALIEFYINKNSTPRSDGDSETVVDFIEDGEYIVASFYQAYGIDLTTCKMHWHLFKALFLGLPDDTIIKQIMSKRSWKKSNQKYETYCEKEKERWALNNDNGIDEELLKEIDELFYNS